VRIPGATYRLQFNEQFRFEHAEAIVPYLDALGVTDVYASPVLTARGGSTHGYDVTDPTRVDERLGGRAGLESLSKALRERGMGLLLDIVPNHMAMSNENPWWMDVLEHGRASRFAGFFDIDWDAPALEGKVLVPVLGSPYAEVLDRGELSLRLEPDGLFVSYADHRFPVDPATYMLVFGDQVEGLGERLGTSHPAFLAVRALLRTISQAPPRRLTGPRSVERRARVSASVKEWLWDVRSDSPEARAFLDGRVRSWGGDPSKPSNRERLDALIAEQAYLLSYWRAAVGEIDYRRFFDVNELVSVRSQDPAVFEAMHALPLELVAKGTVTGLRIDHVDGLHDPQRYLEQLRDRTKGGYVVVEKILTDGETLRDEWPVAGTTGYEFLDEANAVLADPAGVSELGRVYTSLVQDGGASVARSWPEEAAASKREVVHRLFASEVGALAARLQRLARQDRRGRDLTQATLATSLIEVTVALAVYRTYVRTPDVEAADRHLIVRAVDAAREALPAEAHPALAFLRAVLLLELPARASSERVSAWLGFVLRWQQFTGPVMAKGVEDTAMYVYNRLLSRNDVGTDPGADGLLIEEFHRRMRARRRRWPDGLSATSTHDTKRSEDVRARLNALSEMPERWREAVARWSRWNRSKRQEADGVTVPGSNEEWFLYQTLVGAWPLASSEERAFTGRVVETMRKSLREAKVHTNWIEPNEAYERAMERFVRAILARTNRRFLSDLKAFVDDLSYRGMVGSLAQVVLKVCAPGLPDFYQGTELWSLTLVDPDNRGPVDFDVRSRFLHDLDAGPGLGLPELLSRWRDGRLKLWVTSRALRYRRDCPEPFRRGSYLPLTVTGARRSSTCAFARRRGQQWVIAAFPRPGAPEQANDGSIRLPASAPEHWTDVLTGQAVSAQPRHRLHLPDLLTTLPVAMLSNSARP
jgi:(1->4)-alpha-D-glucan 1-alpha-D-glucosylmutase